MKRRRIIIILCALILVLIGGAGYLTLRVRQIDALIDELCGDDRAAAQIAADQLVGDSNRLVILRLCEALHTIEKFAAIEDVLVRIGKDTHLPLVAIIGHRGGREEGLSVLIGGYHESAKRRASRAAIAALIRMGPEAVPALIRATEDRQPSRREDAVSILGLIGDSAAIEPLKRAANDDDPHVRLQAAGALYSLGEKLSLPAILAAAQAEDSLIRFEAVEILADILDPAAFVPFAEATRDPVLNIRMTAVEALGRLGDPRALEPLINVIATD